jgi:hypothetical protein
MDVIFPRDRHEFNPHLYVVALYQLGVYSKRFFYLADAGSWKTL